MNPIAVFVLALFIGAAPIPVSNFEKAHQTTYHIHQETVTGGGSCSATAIGPHVLLTASHCEQPTDILDIQDKDPDNKDEDIKIVRIARDAQDHSILFLKNVTFSSYAKVVSEKGLEIGDAVYTFGNPGMLSDVLRKGYYAGRQKNNNLFDPEPDHLIFDLNIWRGDSGSGVFNVNGDLFAVISDISAQADTAVRIQLAGAFPLVFDQEVLDEARTF